ncbi:MAG: hypothetical protein WC155_06435 [Candidatus Cloacimonadales bacterium]
MTRKNWSREETIIAFNVYCKIPFKSSSKTNPTIIKYAKLIGRTPSALNMKVGNFGRLDPDLKKQGIGGLSHGSRLDEQIWYEFNGNWEELAYESESLYNDILEKWFLCSEKYLIEHQKVIDQLVKEDSSLYRIYKQSPFKNTGHYNKNRFEKLSKLINS